MNVVVTTGPAMARIDEVRHITNVSSGELGFLIANAFARAGDCVTCFYGMASRCGVPLDERVDGRVFSGNEDLAEAMRKRGREGAVDAVFHVAALGDFEVGEIRGEDGRRLMDAKIESRSGAVTIVLKPAPQ